MNEDMTLQEIREQLEEQVRLLKLENEQLVEMLSDSRDALTQVMAEAEEEADLTYSEVLCSAISGVATSHNQDPIAVAKQAVLITNAVMKELNYEEGIVS